LKPGYEVLSDGKIAQLLSTIFFAISYLIAKNLTKTESTHSIVIFLTLFATITLLPFTLLIWTKPIMADLLLLLGVAILGTLGHYFMTIALSLAPLTITQPVIFFQLIWSTLIGLLLFDESLDFFILIGGALIVIAIVRLSANENLS
jgi:drug/metabolite transporter (DMT)-like permease